jgi:ubiquinone/menaquinone biosynthesis C-methylase UbiE
MTTTKIEKAGKSGAKPAAGVELRSHQSKMEPMHWILPDASALLDVGCNVGELLRVCRETYPAMDLAGIDINSSSIEKAKAKLPGADIRYGHGFQLPFPVAASTA